MLVRILLLLLRLLAFPIHLLFAFFRLIFAILLGLSSFVTGILSCVFLLGSAAGWICHAPADMIGRTVGIGIFFAVVSSISKWFNAAR